VDPGTLVILGTPGGPGMKKSNYINKKNYKDFLITPVANFLPLQYC
jgi:hypothetical protein